MRISLRSALENEEVVVDPANPDEERTIVMKGPLAEAYTQALNIVYAKDDRVSVAVEDVEDAPADGGEGSGSTIPGDAADANGAAGGEGGDVATEEDKQTRPAQRAAADTFDVREGEVQEPAGTAGETMRPLVEPAEDPTAIPSLETQAIDATIAQQVADLLVPSADGANQDVTIYGVSEADLSADDVVEVTKELADKPENEDFYLVIDATQPSVNGENSSEPQERVELLGQALESIAIAYGAKVFRSKK